MTYFCFNKESEIVNGFFLNDNIFTMKSYKDYEKQTWDIIQTEVDKYINNNVSPHYAAFDADGTLWDVDAGESFFRYQIDHCELKGLPADPWGHYHEWKERDTHAAYLWLAQINKGQRLEQVRRWAKDNLNSHKEWPIFPQQRKLIQWLKSKGIRVFVVTASIKWAVEPFAELLGLHYDDVIGVETKCVDGVVTDEMSGMITWREGKPRRLLQLTDGVMPLFCSGNTMGDLQLLQSARLLKLAVSAAAQGTELYETEMSLQKVACENAWLSHRFI